MAATTPAYELRWALVFFAIFIVLMLVLRPVLQAHGAPPFMSDIAVGMTSAALYIGLRAAVARRRRLLSGK